MGVRQRASQRTRESRRFRQELRSFGLKVRRQRSAREWTIEHAAERMDVDPTHLAKIEAGTINLTFATVVRIAVGLGLEIAELFASK